MHDREGLRLAYEACLKLYYRSLKCDYFLAKNCKSEKDMEFHELLMYISE